MLGKLIKHEFRATGRLMAPLFGALLLLAVFARVANQILQQVPNPTRVLYIVSVLLAIISCSRFPSVSTACSGRS